MCHYGMHLAPSDSTVSDLARTLIPSSSGLEKARVSMACRGGASEAVRVTTPLGSQIRGSRRPASWEAAGRLGLVPF